MVAAGEFAERMAHKSLWLLILLAGSSLFVGASFFSPIARGQSTSADIHGITRSPAGLLPMPQAQVFLFIALTKISLPTTRR
jgi:hypothetical protein